MSLAPIAESNSDKYANVPENIQATISSIETTIDQIFTKLIGANIGYNVMDKMCIFGGAAALYYQGSDRHK
jgi:hypothetical protein